ncbi:hypothetical protein V5799_026099 [Amblyomma americanum]|uniref:Uncharacterized protein n=1 Tax=Amblyomma americanum TaxID=6943 RepID=A0AAQ4DJJ4_AMBAM
MGDQHPSMSGDIQQLLKALYAVQERPTLDENDAIEPSPREAELFSRVCEEDCIVALGTPELRRHLCVAFILALKPPGAFIVGPLIPEDKDFLEYLRLFFPDEVWTIASATSWTRDALSGVCIVEPDVLWALIADGALETADIRVLVLRDFQHYLDTRHPYHKIVSHLQQSPTSTRLLALADELRASRMDILESDLKRLRTPLKLACHLGTPVRPYTKGVALEYCLIELDWFFQVDWQCASDTLSWSDDPIVQEVGVTLREHGVLPAFRHAKEAVTTNPCMELTEFLLLSREKIANLKGSTVAAYVQGRTLALTTSLESMCDLRDFLRSQSPLTVIEEPDEVALASSVVLVATTADLPTLRRYYWDAVVLCDLPVGVSCDGLLANADCKALLATPEEWTRWQALLKVHDELDSLLLRVNQ